MFYPATPTHYILNGGLGDVIAASPVIKYAIENFHKDGKYLVSTAPAYRDILWFVPDDKFNSIFEKYEFEEEYQHVRTYPLGETKAPKSILSKVASYNLINKILPDKDRDYPLYFENINVDNFNRDFTKCVIISVGFRSAVKSWDLKILNELIEWIIEKDHVPVLIGSSKEPFDPNEKTIKNLKNLETKIPDLSQFKNCINLTDKTNIKQLIGIFQKAKCLVSYDGGIVHLAGLTNIPIVCAYTFVNPESGMFFRNGKFGCNMYPVNVDESKCRFCSTDWHLFNFDFNSCWSGTLECRELKLEQFTNPLKNILEK